MYCSKSPKSSLIVKYPGPFPYYLKKRREIILLSMSGMSEQMIADTLNISINTVKNQKTKPMPFLRQELKDISSFVLFIWVVKPFSDVPACL